jgi:endonuclease/exonuclease/phosphatase family metal-dependent hydrolase
VLLLCYNVENLFDERPDGGEYPEYRSSRWGPAVVEAKLAALARAIRAASPRGADILLLQEVENLRILEALRDRHLAALGYRYALLVPQEGVATRVGLLSRLPVVRSHAHDPGRFEGLPLRAILEVELELEGRRLIVFNNHWKSKSGGVAETAGGRRLAAAALRRRMAEILAEDPAADVVVAGDFNENVGELAALLPLDLYEPWYELPAEERGSSVYQGRWQTPDHILLAPGLFDDRGFSYVRGSFRVLRRRFLLHGGSGFPRRFTPSGGRRGRGASDHLPVLVQLQLD